MSRLMKMGIKRDALSNGVNIMFQSLPNNPKKLSLEEYLMQRGYVPLQDDKSLLDEVYNRYKVRRIESSFVPFVDTFREDFKFSADVLGWIKNPATEQLNELVPESWPYAMGRTFFQYFGQCKAIGSDVYYSMHTFYEGYSKLIEVSYSEEVRVFYDAERYVSRPTDPDETEFWLFYDHFGKNSVVLDTEMPAI